RIGSRRGDEERGRRPLTQGFMGTHLVVLVEEAVEARLLGAHARCRWLGSGLLERPVEALVAAVLLRLTGLDALGLDAELEPPHRQPRQPAGPAVRKGRTIVAAQRTRQPELAECRLEARAGMLVIAGGQRAADQGIAAEGVAYRQRIAARPVRGAEPTLEVDAPDVVGRLHGRKRLLIGWTASASAALAHQIGPLQPVADRTRRRDHPIRVLLLQLHTQLLRSLPREALLQLHPPQGPSPPVAPAPAGAAYARAPSLPPVPAHGSAPATCNRSSG